MTTVQKLLILAVLYVLLSGEVGGKVDFVTFVYEKDSGSVPAAVLSGLNKLNEQKISAQAFDKDTKNGNQQIPEQFKVAVEAAKELPSLVAQSGKKVVRVIKNPKTEDEVIKAGQ